MDGKELEELKKQIEALHELELDVSERVCDVELVEKIQKERIHLEDRVSELENKQSNMKEELRVPSIKGRPVFFSQCKTDETLTYGSQIEELHDMNIQSLLRRATELVIASGGSR